MHERESKREASKETGISLIHKVWLRLCGRKEAKTGSVQIPIPNPYDPENIDQFRREAFRRIPGVVNFCSGIDAIVKGEGTLETSE